MIVRDGVFVDSTGFFDRTGLAAGIDDVAAFWRGGGEQKDEIGLSFVGDDLKPTPFLEFIEGGHCHYGNAGTVFEENGFGGKDCGGDFLWRRSLREWRLSLLCVGGGNDQE